MISRIYSVRTFYEDWDQYEYRSCQEAVDELARRSPGRMSGAIAALQDLLEASLTDAELDDRLRRRVHIRVRTG